jgi:outer membrane protein OmpA-like peptidoglycan-associated protein
MKKTKIFLLAGVVLPAFAIAAPSIAAPFASEGAIVVAQSDDSDKQQRREERQQQKQERQQQREERQQTREERPNREDRPSREDRAQQREERQPSREDRPSREERQQTREDRPSREERQQQKQERQQQDQPSAQSTDDRPKAREDRPSREERQQQKEERQQQKQTRDGGSSMDSQPKATRDATPARSDEDRSERRRNREEERANEKSPGSDRPNASDKSDDNRGRLQQMREDRERDRAGGDDRTNREKLDDVRDKRREERRDERREDKRQDERVDNLKDRIKDEKRENEKLDDRIDKLKDERKETRDGDRIIITEPGGRRIIRDGNRVIINRNENARFLIGVRPGDIREERRGGEIRTVVTRPDGSRIVTVTDDNGRLIRRVREYRGQEYVLIDNRPRGGAGGLFINLDIAPPRVSIPRERYVVDADVASEDDIYEAFSAEPVERLERSYSLDEIRQSAPLRQYVRSVDLDSVTFDTGSWYVRDDQIGKLEKVGEAMETAIKKNPRTVFMVEGHTDAVGSDNDNLSLSDRRAESVAEVLTKYFDIPAENLTTQGYGEEYLKIQTDGPEERNRRVTVRNITRLLSAEK